MTSSSFLFCSISRSPAHEMRSGSLAHSHGDGGCYNPLIGAASDTVSAEEFACHSVMAPLIAHQLLLCQMAQRIVLCFWRGYRAKGRA